MFMMHNMSPASKDHEVRKLTAANRRQRSGDEDLIKAKLAKVADDEANALS
jgi:hypothetical protein